MADLVALAAVAAKSDADSDLDALIAALGEPIDEAPSARLVEGFNVYPVPSGSGLYAQGLRWAVQTADNKAKGVASGFGDGLFRSLEEAEAQAKREAQRERDRAEMQAAAEAKAAEDAAAALRAADTDGFADQFKGAAVHRARMILNEAIYSKPKGKFTTRKQFIRDAVEAGARPDMIRTDRVLRMPGGGFYTAKDITKTAIDYAAYLIARKEEAAEAQVAPEPEIDRLFTGDAALDAVSIPEFSRLVESAENDDDIDALIAALGEEFEESKPAPAPMTFDYNDPIGTLNSLRAQLESTPEEARPEAAQYIAAAGRYLNVNDGNRDEVQKIAGDMTKQIQAYRAIADTPERRRQTFAAFAAAGSIALQAAEDGKPAYDKVRAINDELRLLRIDAENDMRKRREELRAHSNGLLASYREALKSGDTDRAEDLYRQYDAALEAVLIRPETREYSAEFAERIADKQHEADALRAGVGETLRVALFNASPIDRDAAAQWAAQQKITKTAAARLKKMGYAPDAVRADMAEFYRMTGGRLAAVTIDSSGGRRANAEGVHGYGDSIINLGSSFDKRVLWHEMGHHLEADPQLLAATKGFLEKRRRSDEAVSLRKITGDKGYERYEVAYEDGFFSAYVGKVYSDATEVLSMGLESFSDPKILGDRIMHDPEMFALVTGAISSPVNPLFGTVKKLRTQAAEAQEAKAVGEGEERSALIGKYTASVKIDPNETYGADLTRIWLGIGAKGAKLIGGWNGFLFVQVSGMKNPETRRRGNCIVIWSRDTGAPMSYCFDGIERAKAIAKAKSEGVDNPAFAIGDVVRLRRIVNGTP